MKKITLDKSKFIKRDFFKLDKKQSINEFSVTDIHVETWTIPDDFKCDDGYSELTKEKTRF